MSRYLIGMKVMFDHFGDRFSSLESGLLGEGLELDFDFDCGSWWAPKRRPNLIKKSLRKKMPTKAQHDSQNGLMNRRRGKIAS